jgi:hypothetical protein
MRDGMPNGCHAAVFMEHPYRAKNSQSFPLWQAYAETSRFEEVSLGYAESFAKDPRTTLESVRKVFNFMNKAATHQH